ncbi:MAG: sulfatase [Candidatus Hydrogenedentes bacterium]|nr:sulfatase [Candidatus Hydrogenedentota bacterium]
MNKTQKILVCVLIIVGFTFIWAGHYIKKIIPPYPNIVFILIDTLRADCVDPSLKPHPITPFLSSLAENSIYFSDAVTPCSWTKPTMATLFTGISPEKHQVRYSTINEDPNKPTSDVLPEKYLTLPEYLSQYGYETYAVQTNGNLVPQLGFAQGFNPENYHFLLGAVASTVTQKAKEILSNAKSPFFLYLHYLDPHAPYSPPMEILEKVANEQILSEEEREWTKPHKYMEYLTDLIKYRTKTKAEPPNFEYSNAGKQELHRLYLGEVLYVDTEVQKIVEFIKRNYPKTIFIILSDHGEEFWEHNCVGHGTTLYEEQVRVPVIIHGWNAPPKNITKPVSTAGLANTILRLSNIPTPPQFEERDMLTIGESEDISSYMVTWGPWRELNIQLRGIIKFPWKLIENIITGEIELYNLEEDSKEMVNISKTNEEIVKYLLNEMKNYITNIEYTGVNTTELTTDIKSQLESLGYLGN